MTTTSERDCWPHATTPLGHKVSSPCEYATVDVHVHAARQLCACSCGGLEVYPTGWIEVRLRKRCIVERTNAHRRNRCCCLCFGGSIPDHHDRPFACATILHCIRDDTIPRYPREVHGWMWPHGLPASTCCADVSIGFFLLSSIC